MDQPIGKRIIFEENGQRCEYKLTLRVTNQVFLIAAELDKDKK